jgi:hypothetical protein
VLVRIRNILAGATPRSIVIINEIFSSTSLRDAVSLSTKIADAIMGRDLICVWVTFIDEIAFLSRKMVCMVSTVVPENPAERTFKLVRQPADGLAYAMSIAEKYRLTYGMIKERIGPMKARLLHRNADFDWRWALQAEAEREFVSSGRRYNRPQSFAPQSELPWNAEALAADLALTTVFEAMAADDSLVFEVARKVILTGVTGDLDTIAYRQAVLLDCLRQPVVVRELYAIAREARHKQRAHYLGVLARYPDYVLRDAVDAMMASLDFLRRLRRVADLRADKFVSEGWTSFFGMLKGDLDGEYLICLTEHLETLKLRNGELISGKLGTANKGSHYVLHRTPARKWTLAGWLSGLVEEKPPVYRFDLHPRDEAGAQALAALRNRGIALAANALGQAAEHVRDFFGMLQSELAFYVGCLNLHDRLAERGEPVCMPVTALREQERLWFRSLYDFGLALTMDPRVVGNDIDAEAPG